MGISTDGTEFTPAKRVPSVSQRRSMFLSQTSSDQSFDSISSPMFSPNSSLKKSPRYTPDKTFKQYPNLRVTPIEGSPSTERRSIKIEHPSPAHKTPERPASNGVSKVLSKQKSLHKNTSFSSPSSSSSDSESDKETKENEPVAAKRQLMKTEKPVEQTNLNLSSDVTNQDKKKPS